MDLIRCSSYSQLGISNALRSQDPLRANRDVKQEVIIAKISAAVLVFGVCALSLSSSCVRCLGIVAWNLGLRVFLHGRAVSSQVACKK